MVTLPSLTSWLGLLQFGNSYYEIRKLPMTYDEALAEAHSRTWNGLNGYLATITSPEEQQFLTQYILNTYRSDANFPVFWIAGRYESGNWVWDDGPEAGTFLQTPNGCQQEFCPWESTFPSSPNPNSRMVFNPSGLWKNFDHDVVVPGAVYEFTGMPMKL